MAPAENAPVLGSGSSRKSGAGARGGIAPPQTILYHGLGGKPMATAPSRRRDEGSSMIEPAEADFKETGVFARPLREP